MNEGGANAPRLHRLGEANLTDRVGLSPTNDQSRFFKVTVEMP